jgi:hypothetical protein
VSFFPLPGQEAYSLVGEEEEAEGDLDGDEREEDLEPAHEADGKVEALDFGLVACDERRGEDVCPEVLALAERDLEVHTAPGRVRAAYAVGKGKVSLRLGMLALLVEHVERVVVDVRATICAIVSGRRFSTASIQARTPGRPG